MADTHDNTATQSFYADDDIANIVSAFNLDNLSSTAAAELASYCEESMVDLCHILRFVGKSFITFANSNLVLSPATLHQAGHGIEAVSLLIPLLSRLERLADAHLLAAHRGCQ